MKYPKILNRSKLLILFIVFIFSGCSSINTLKFKNIVKVNDVYYQKTSDLGKVKLTTPKTNGKYEFVNYEASKLEVGTKIYKLENEDFIAVEIKDIDTVYQKYKRISPNEIIKK